MELQMPHLTFFRGAMMRKKSFKLRIPKFFIVCRPHKQTQASQVLVSTLQSTFHLSTNFSFAELICSPIYINSGTHFE